jgi:putative acetyltransferase
MKAIIRPIEKSDNPVLAQIIRATFKEHNAPTQGTVYSDPTTDELFEVFQHSKSACWVAELKGEVVGCCGIYPTEGLDKGCCELVKYYINPKARGLGIGRQLLYQCEASAIDLGYDAIYIESFPEFGKAVRIYENAGYRTIPKAMGNSGHYACTIFMIKDISFANLDS